MRIVFVNPNSGIFDKRILKVVEESPCCQVPDENDLVQLGPNQGRWMVTGTQFDPAQDATFVLLAPFQQRQSRFG